MRSTLRRALLVGALCAATVCVVSTCALAADGGSQLMDIGHQMADLHKKLDDLQTKGHSAKAGKLSEAAVCDLGESAQVFSAWDDSADYSLVPQGDLSDTSGWSLKNTEVSDDHDPFGASAQSLVFNKGDSQAVTPVLCVDLDNPTMRFFVADRGGNGKARLEVKVLYEALDGSTKDLTLANIKVDDAWQPSLVIPIGVNLLAVASANGWTPVAFSFKVHGLQKGETFALDGVYVDPFRSR